MLAISLPGKKRDLAPGWMVSDAQLHSKHTYQQSERVGKSYSRGSGDSRGGGRGGGKGDYKGGAGKAGGDSGGADKGDSKGRGGKGRRGGRGR